MRKIKLILSLLILFIILSLPTKSNAFSCYDYDTQYRDLTTRKTECLRTGLCNFYDSYGGFACNKCAPKAEDISTTCRQDITCSNLNNNANGCVGLRAYSALQSSNLICDYFSTCNRCFPKNTSQDTACPRCGSYDQTYIQVGGPGGINNVYTPLPSTGEWGVGQPLRFTPTKRGILDKIEVIVSTGTDKSNVFEIKLIDPATSVNLTEAFRQDLGPGYNNWTTIDFGSEPMLEANKQYEITFKKNVGMVSLGRGNNWAWSYKVYIKPCSANSPTATPTPITEVSLTSTPIPTVDPNCVCSTDFNCNPSCVFVKLGNVNYNNPIRCSRESAIVGPTIYPLNLNQYCQRPKRTMGDADGSGVVDEDDYLYYLRSVLHAPVPATVNADFNGDGMVSASDLEIWLAGREVEPTSPPSVTNTIAPTSPPAATNTPIPTNTSTPTPSPTPQSCTVNCQRVAITSAPGCTLGQKAGCTGFGDNYWCAGCGTVTGCYTVSAGKHDCGCWDGSSRKICDN